MEMPSTSATREGLDQFLEVLRSVEVLAGTPPIVIFELTGHYYTPITQLDERYYVYILVNPLVAHQAKGHHCQWRPCTIRT
jgi:transposase